MVCMCGQLELGSPVCTKMNQGYFISLGMHVTYLYYMADRAGAKQ